VASDGLIPQSALRLAAGDLDALLLPDRGMLGASLRHQGEELLRRIDDLAAAAAKGSSTGIPLLHPWANRLAGPAYEAAGRRVTLDPASRLLHLDGNRLPMHGVGWAQLGWEVCEAKPERIAARLEWNRTDLLAIFPYPHHLEMTVTLRPDALTVQTVLVAGPEAPVPVSFGFHPYFGIPGLPRNSLLGERDFDDGFALLEEPPAFSLAGAGREISLRFLCGYRYAQVFAPKDKEYVAIEPMTAPTNALLSGRGLTLVKPGERFRTAFSITVQSIPASARP
jgi:aldose 1-epimerase